MYTSNNQVIFEEIYDENIQPTEEEIIEYANFLGIDAQDVNFLRFLSLMTLDRKLILKVTKNLVLYI
jgi:hypothetical protein